jgi:hypothetical protein
MEKSIEGSGFNKVTLIYDSLRFKVDAINGFRFPTMKVDGSKIEKFD